MTMTRIRAIKLFAQRTGLTFEAAEKQVDDKSSKWTNFAEEHSIQIQTEKDHVRSILGTTAIDIDEALDRSWESIKTLQGKIEESIEGDDIRHLKDICASLTSLQKSFQEMAEIKKQHDADLHLTVSRDTVENIIQGCFPELKKGLEEMFVRIKADLPEDQRAAFDVIYQKHLPDYGKHLQKTVNKLNSLLEG